MAILTIYNASELTTERRISDDFISYYPKNGIKITTISTCRKIFIFLNIFKKQIGKHAEELVAVLTIQRALKLTHGKAQPRIFFILY